MSLIRVGLIGLSSSGAENPEEGASWAANAHLPFLKASPHFEIVALLNSSLDRAKKAITHYGLSPETRAYGDPQEFANDPAVDLVVCCVRVDRHLSTLRPSIEAGKTLYVEWPLDRNFAVAQEMAWLARKHNAKTIVGLQGSYAPVIRKMREVIGSGSIGRVLSSTLVGAAGYGGATQSKRIRYFLDHQIGGNMLSILGGHLLEYMSSVLGEWKSVSSTCAISWPVKDITDPDDDNKIIEQAVPNTVPDQILLHGFTDSNAFVTVRLHGCLGPPNTPQVDWRIQGENAWLRVTSSGPYINVGYPETKLELYDMESGEVKELVPEINDWNSLPLPAQNIADLYDACRKNHWYPDFDWALKRHEQIDQIWNQYKSSARDI
ncbi:putative oxidoreductase [Xylona heveae TC161]|uniref:Putative oxidoreductase n=1 Tax=Xylona heveae (strain CBS 132557 / TC161) TaxID=1328760 RepID=A0A164ZNG5_XYLHT|nr:putative oxidoreductase [Xylona heveae TC161]KZF19309.1 putative oxidoreductase [Xylona heveae TC161]